ncbi:N-acetylmuramoyl-L-alanine amidase [Marinifilum sp. N1E240]|uniref:N-acetylmuramoyl-L-alanine amidase n=1 Tax=Marinifilum sp. N1E240 TaxID=2608082 RepID=UPI00128E8EA2|nr:N-acetylmuramoyl-L-alanine amidase [Marinifilum sp. N1E240]MPQ46889.1 N-acetylmuramoyl-L-alanine amidase [Marinifilum sp. N1E240]
MNNEQITKRVKVLTKNLNESKEVIIHASASSFGNALLIDSWHREKGYDEIGYNYVVLNGYTNSGYYDEVCDGLIESGRRTNKSGAHTYGHNRNTIGICLISKDGIFTENQMNSLINLLRMLKSKHGDINIKQHSDIDPTNKPFCAGIHPDVMERIKEII